MNKTQHKKIKLNPLVYWFTCHCRAFVFSIGEILRTPIASVMTLTVIGIAMALPTGLYVFLQNFQGLSKNWNSTPSISLYLKQNISDSQTKNLIKQINKIYSVAMVQYISPTEGLKQFEQLTEFNKVLSILNDNPLPRVLIVIPKKSTQTSKQLQQLLSTLKQFSQVDIGQLDLAWVKRLYYIVLLGKRITYTMTVLFSIGVILIIGNTIRLTTQNHQYEIEVLQLIGATQQFIRRPLLYRGLLYGILGGAIAWLFVAIFFKWLKAPAQALALTYNNPFLFHGVSMQFGLSMVIISAILGLIGSLLSVHHLMN